MLITSQILNCLENVLRGNNIHITTNGKKTGGTEGLERAIAHFGSSIAIEKILSQQGFSGPA